MATRGIVSSSLPHPRLIKTKKRLAQITVFVKKMGEGGTGEAIVKAKSFGKDPRATGDLLSYVYTYTLC